MAISPKKKALLCEYNNNCCENCKEQFITSELHPHRIRPGAEGGTYEHRNVKILCKKCHNLISEAYRMTLGLT